MPDRAGVDAYLQKLTGHAKPIGDALARELDRLGPELTRSLAWGFPCWTGNERVFSVIAHSDRCNLQLWSGARLAKRFPDLIEGTGKQLRHVKVRHTAEINDDLRAVIIAAIELDISDPERVR